MSKSFTILIYTITLVLTSNILFSLDIRDLKDTNNITVFDEIENLSFDEVHVGHIEKLKGKKVKNIGFHQCFGSINEILSIIDKSHLKSLSINECIIKDTLINLDGAKDITIEVKRTEGCFKFTNLVSCIVFSSIFNTMPLDLKEFNLNIEILHLDGYDPLFLRNVEEISRFKRLKSLRLGFPYAIDEEIILENHFELQLLYLTNFTNLPRSINTNKLEDLWIDKIYNLDVNYIDSIISENKSLNSLSIMNCNLKKIPNSILKLKSLNLLNLSNNKISELDYDFSKWEELQTLFLDNNYISDFNYNLFELPNDIQVDLRFNNLKERIIKPKDRDIIINQEGNPFKE